MPVYNSQNLFSKADFWRKSTPHQEQTIVGLTVVLLTTLGYCTQGRVMGGYEGYRPGAFVIETPVVRGVRRLAKKSAADVIIRAVKTHGP